VARRRQSMSVVALFVDDEGCIVSRVFDPRAWPFGLTDVTGDTQEAVTLLRAGEPVRCVRDEEFLDSVKRLYAEGV
jgi:hypothetical protein